MTKRERIAAYREAARRVAHCEEHYACNALFRLERNDGAKNVMKPFGSLRPLRVARANYGMGWYGTPQNPENRRARVLALLLAAEMVRTGDL